MKKLVVFLLLSTSLVIVFFSSCKKYEDGHSFGLTPLNQRVAGEWSFSSVISKDAEGVTVDQTSLYDGYKLTLKSNGGGSLYTPIVASTNAHWVFSGSQDNIYLTIGAVKTKYEILKLTSKKMWLRQNNVDGSSVEIKLEQ